MTLFGRFLEIEQEFSFFIFLAGIFFLTQKFRAELRIVLITAIFFGVVIIFATEQLRSKIMDMTCVCGKADRSTAAKHDTFRFLGNIAQAHTERSKE